MNEQEQNIAIAESMGLIPFNHHQYGWVDQGGVAIPKYTNDLNAMHEVEKTLESDPWDVYCEYLEGCDWPAYAAPAAQRAEAYLRTIGKWEDTE